jgi:uncharacterized protein YktA (UPF0223 family)
MEYQYPIDHTWTTNEIIDVIHFFEHVEHAYEKGVSREILMDSYRRFKEIVPSKSEEKKLFNQFEEESGYSSYRTVQKAKEVPAGEKVKMKMK